MRRTGKTTRLINKIVEDIFKYKEIKISMYHNTDSDYLDPDSLETNSEQEILVAKLFKRLEQEHKDCFDVSVIFNGLENEKENILIIKSK